MITLRPDGHQQPHVAWLHKEANTIVAFNPIREEKWKIGVFFEANLDLLHEEPVLSHFVNYF